MSETTYIIASNLKASIEGGRDGLFENRITPDGHVVSRAGDFFVDQESFDAMRAEFVSHGTPLPIDYEHQTLGGEYAAPDGKAPAAGWMESIHYRPGEGVFAMVRWTDRATAMIRSGEYKYLSPVVAVQKDDQKALGLHSAGLTNTPAIEHMDVLAAKDNVKEIANMDGETTTTPTKETTTTAADSPEMLLGAIMSQLSIDLESTDIIEGLKAVLAKVSKSSDDKEGDGDNADAPAAKVANKLKTALDLKQDATDDELIVAVNSLKHNAKGDGESAKELAELKDQLGELQADKIIEPYLAANKINPNDKEDLKVCRALAKNDPAALAHQMKHRAAYAEPGKTEAGDAGGGGKRLTRDKLIANSAKQFDKDGGENRLTSRDNFVNGELIQAGHKELTDDERAKLVV